MNKGTSYEIQLDYAKTYLDPANTDALTLAAELIKIFSLCPWEAEEIAMEAIGEVQNG